MRYLKIFLLIVGFVVGGSLSGHAMTFKGLDGLTVELVDAGQKNGDMRLMRITGIESAWADKVFQVERIPAARGDRYIFSYTLALSTGDQVKDYYILTSAGSVFKDNSYLDRYQLYLPEYRGREIYVWIDPDAESTADDLQAAYKKNPFKPAP